MPVSLSIKDVPDALAARLRERAARNHRSLQRELMTIVETAAQAPDAAPRAVVAAAPQAPIYAVARPVPPPSAGDGDGLLAELDAIVAGSRWGRAPVLTRAQANDRRLAREVEFDARQASGPGVDA